MKYSGYPVQSSRVNLEWGLIILLVVGAGHARDFENDRGHGPLLQADSLIAK